MSKEEETEEVNGETNNHVHKQFLEDWAQNTTAHGVSRVANTRKAQRVIWILALLASLVYLSIELYRSIDLYYEYRTTTEINKINRLKINFPSVTFCNFNRWRKSHMKEDVVKQLEDVLALYSYSYVIPEINDGVDPNDIDVETINARPTPKPTPKPPTTTTPPPIQCKVPEPLPGLTYAVNGSVSLQGTVAIGTSITYTCSKANDEPRDGDTEHTCTESGQFQGKTPICINVGDSGAVYTLINSASDADAVAVSKPLNATHHGETITSMTLCFWMKMMEGNKLGTILSYGVGGESILSVIQVPHKQLNNIYGVKYKLFGAEGRTLSLISYGEWAPLCLQYSIPEQRSKGSSVKLFKYLVFSNGFQQYGDDVVKEPRLFPLHGNIVLFNYYQNYLRLSAGTPLELSATGGQLANVNMWDRIIPVEIMNRMLWQGNVYSMVPESVTIMSGEIQSTSINVSVTDIFGEKRERRSVQAEKPANTSDPTTTNSILDRSTTDGDVAASSISSARNTDISSTNSLAENNADPSNSTEQVSNISAAGSSPTVQTSTALPTNSTAKPFNYADFTLKAGWQLVDEHSKHRAGEPRTLLSCTYRGKKCDSRWFTHRFGAYGNCYTFNQNISQSLADEQKFRLPIIQDSSGPTGGLNMLLDVQTWEYSESTALNGNSELGLKFIVHANYEVPVINSMGYAVSPGQKAFVGFAKTTVSNMFEPWGKCDPERKLKYYTDQYTVDACAIECKLQKVVEICNCKPYYYPGDFDICSVSELSTCAFIEIAKVNADFGTLCDCPIACNAENYDVKLSYTSFPNLPFGVQLGEELNITVPTSPSKQKLYASKAQYIGNNVANLDLYYESMSETIMNQNKAMDLTALLGNIGGQLGLFLGCSFLTAFELLECIVMSFAFQCKRKKSVTISSHKYSLPSDATQIDLENGTSELNDGSPVRSINHNKNRKISIVRRSDVASINEREIT